MTTQIDTPLELGDIQAGALMPRPNPYAGMYVAVRIDHRQAGRELLRRLIPLLDPVSSFDPGRPVSLGVGLSFSGLRGARRAGGVAGHLPGRVPAGHGRSRRLASGMSGRTRRRTGRRRWAPRTSTSWWPRWRGTPRSWRPWSRWRSDAMRDLPGVSPIWATGRARATERARAVRLQGQHRPAGG